jgi:hypothetical protein
LAPLDTVEIELLARHLEVCVLRSGQSLLRAGERATHAAVVLAGVLREFYPLADDPAIAGYTDARYQGSQDALRLSGRDRSPQRIEFTAEMKLQGAVPAERSTEMAVSTSS